MLVFFPFPGMHSTGESFHPGCALSASMGVQPIANEFAPVTAMQQSFSSLVGWIRCACTVSHATGSSDYALRLIRPTVVWTSSGAASAAIVVQPVANEQAVCQPLMLRTAFPLPHAGEDQGEGTRSGRLSLLVLNLHPGQLPQKARRNTGWRRYNSRLPIRAKTEAASASQ